MRLSILIFLTTITAGKKYMNRCMFAKILFSYFLLINDTSMNTYVFRVYANNLVFLRSTL